MLTLCRGGVVVLTEGALWHHGRGDLPAGPDPLRGLAGRLAGHAGEEGTGGGADEASQTRPRGNNTHIHRGFRGGGLQEVVLGFLCAATLVYK